MHNISRELIGQIIAIQSKNSKYFISSNQRILDNSLGLATTEQKGWEKFRVVQGDDKDFVYLKDCWGKFLSGEKDGRVSQKKDPREWEQFKIWQDDSGNIYFLNFHGSWLKIGPTGQVFCESRLNNSAELDIKICD
ncbi:MAG: hypothetical protein AB8G05_25910 [Oligoflexales bacterium]